MQDVEFWNNKLLYAAKFGEKNSVEECLDNGAQVNCQDYESYGWTPLHYAARYTHTAIVDMLLKHGAIIDSKDCLQYTPLHGAVLNGNKDMVDLLLSKGATVDSKTIIEEDTPLHDAAKNGHTDTVNLLISLGAVLDCKNREEDTPLHDAAKNGHTDTVNLLIFSGAGLEIQNREGFTALHRAAMCGQTAVVDLLISKGAIIDIKDIRGWTPLHWAASNGCTTVVDKLIKNKAIIDSNDKEGRTPYLVAGNDQIKEIIKDAQDHISAGLPLEFFQLDKLSASVFTDLLKEDSYELFELPSMLLGEKDTGKSTIARFLVGKDPIDRLSTDDVDLSSNLSFFDDKTEEWLCGNQDFTMEDIIVSRCIKYFNKQGVLHQELKMGEQEKTQSVSSANISEVIYKRHALTSLSPTEAVAGVMKNPEIDLQSLMAPEMKMSKSNEIKYMLSIEGEMLQRQDNISEGMQDSKSKMHYPMNQRDLSIKVEKERGIIPADNSETIENPGILKKILMIFWSGKSEIKKIKTPVTMSDFLDKARNVAKKEFHIKRKIVPVTIWDFGGQDVFYSTYQTFLTYRAVYMLVLDGSRTLNKPCKYKQFLPGRDVAKTQKDYVRFWTNAIVTYCKGDIPGFPKIMVILTHKDKLEKTEIESRRNEIFGEIEKMFDGSSIQQHLAIKDRIFVNAKDCNDPEIGKIKTTLIQQAKIQPIWGQKLPKCFLPLELEIQYLVKKGCTLIHIDHMKKVNAQHAICPLADSELKFFLKHQHSMGKILYFDEPLLDQHIIISPLYLIDAFKSIITDQRFYKDDEQGEAAWLLMTKKGIILKKAVEAIWKQKYTHSFESMEHLIGVMTHLDILVEPRRNDSRNSLIPTCFFYVASMERKEYTTSYLQSSIFSQRNIALSFEISDSNIPPLLPFRFISFCLSIWSVKTDDKIGDMLFNRSAVFLIDPSLEVHIQFEDERLIVRLVHATSRTLIMRDMASSIRECLSKALREIIQIYIRTSSESTRYTGSFDVKVCCSSLVDPCSIAIQNIDHDWICTKHQIKHTKDLVLSWFTKKEEGSCDFSCPATDEDFLQQTPTDLHLRRLTLAYTQEEVAAIVIELGLSFMERNELFNNITLTPDTMKCTALKRCSEKKLFTFKDLKLAAENQKYDPHKLCKVVRDEHISFDTEPEKWDLSLTDEHIAKLAPVVGNRSLGLLLELGMPFHDLETIEYGRKERDLVQLNRNIIEVWKKTWEKLNIKVALRTIRQAFGNIGINIKIIENKLFN